MARQVLGGHDRWVPGVCGPQPCDGPSRFTECGHRRLIAGPSSGVPNTGLPACLRPWRLLQQKSTDGHSFGGLIEMVDSGVVD